MLIKFQKLKGCGIFQDFSWPGTGLEECKKYNLIFGWNGTGKSTLSGILRQLELRQKPDGDHIHLEWNSSIVREADFTTADCSLKVFNSHFVDETVEGELKPIAVFGKANLDKKKKLDEIVKELNSLSRSLPTLLQAKDKEEKELDRFCIAAAKTIKTSLGREGNAYSTYDKRRFKTKADALSQLPADERKLVSESDQELLLTRIRAPFKEALSKPALKVPDLAQLRKATTALRERSVVSEALDTLSNDQILSDWVQEGMSIHKERDSETCLYCGQPLPEDRKASLEKHFSNALTQLQGEIANSLREIATANSSLSAVEFPKKAELIDDLAAKYAELLDSTKHELTQFIEELDQLRNLLEGKQRDIFTCLTTEFPKPLHQVPSLGKLFSLLDQHNDASKNHSSGVSEAQKSYETACAMECLAAYEEKKKACERAAAEYDTAIRRRDECTRESRKLREELVSHQIPAKELTADLARYLGHADLALEAHDEGYRVTRRGELAKKLSDGEKTAIAVLYFLKTFSDESFQLEESVIVFDDPVSSLDSNALYNAFAFIKDRSKAAKQLIILTHNFPFFRLVREWFKNLRGQDKKQWRIMMLEASCTAEGRYSAIVEIDPLLVGFDSEYQYLFGRIYSLAAATSSPPLETFLPAPNMARRVLEAFLAFKAPFPGDSSLFARLESVDRDVERRSRIYRFCNMQSHLNAVGDYDEDLSALSGAPALLKDILALIEDADGDHYRGMVNCINACTS